MPPCAKRVQCQHDLMTIWLARTRLFDVQRKSWGVLLFDAVEVRCDHTSRRECSIAASQLSTRFPQEKLVMQPGRIGPDERPPQSSAGRKWNLSLMGMNTVGTRQNCFVCWHEQEEEVRSRYFCAVSNMCSLLLDKQALSYTRKLY